MDAVGHSLVYSRPLQQVEWGTRYCPVCVRCLRPRSQYSARHCRACYEEEKALNAVRRELRRPISHGRMMLRALSRRLLFRGRQVSAIWRAKQRQLRLEQEGTERALSLERREARRVRKLEQIERQAIKRARRRNLRISHPRNILGASKFVSVSFAQGNDLTPEDFVCQIEAVLDRLIHERGLSRETAMQVIAENL